MLPAGASSFSSNHMRRASSLSLASAAVEPFAPESGLTFAGVAGTVRATDLPRSSSASKAPWSLTDGVLPGSFPYGGQQGTSDPATVGAGVRGHAGPVAHVDLGRVPEPLRHAWNEREERDRDRATAERRRLAAEDERSLADLRRVRFETSVADWEVARWTQQLDMLQTQLDEWEEEFRLITRPLAP
ncbi:hypothetical protein HK405_011203 [Cladochytrium tenue]|nr:hypothetical protein HK405_011203 [Cladochytrium tenue]